jgi:hypothetical protein
MRLTPEHCKRIARLLPLLTCFVVGVQAETIIGADISEDTTWTKDGSPYILDTWQHLDIFTNSGNVTLTIEAGVEVLFRHARSMNVGNNGVLVINGTDLEPVTFDLYEGEGNDDWRLEFNTNRANQCLINHAVFRNGSGNMVSTEFPEGAVMFRNCAFRNADQTALKVLRDCAAKIESCTFANNGGPGIEYDRASADPSINYLRDSRFEGHTSVENPAVRVIFHGGGMPAISNNDGSNGTFVLVSSINVDIRFPSMTWFVPGTCDDGTPIPYVVDGLIFWEAPEGETSTLTIAPGNILKLRGSGFDFGPDVALHAQGDAANPILFTNTTLWEDENPSWRWISFHQDSLVAQSVLQYLTFENGGSSGQGTLVWDNRYSDASLAIENCTFRNSQDPAIFVDQDWDNDGTFSELRITGCLFEQNQDCDIQVRGANSDGPGVLITDCRFEHGNRWTTAAIRTSNPRLVFSGDNTATNDAFVQLDKPNGQLTGNLTLQVPATLDDGGAMPYVLPSVTGSQGWFLHVPEDDAESVSVTFDPGCVFHFQTNPSSWSPRIQFGRHVTVRAEGTVEMPIVFSATDRWDTDNAFWAGLRFNEEASESGHVFRHVIVKDAETGILSDAPGTLRISDSLFEDNATGVKLDGGSAGDLLDSRFIGNDTGLQVGNSGGSDQQPVPLNIVACTFQDNDTGLYFGSAAEGTEVLGCEFVANKDYAIQNARRINVDAHTCDFGHSSGPLDDSDEEDTNFLLGYTHYNPGGKGDPVSDDVRYGADSDNDGIEDSWEILHFRDLTTTDGSAIMIRTGSGTGMSSPTAPILKRGIPMGMGLPTVPKLTPGLIPLPRIRSYSGRRSPRCSMILAWPRSSVWAPLATSPPLSPQSREVLIKCSSTDCSRKDQCAPCMHRLPSSGLTGPPLSSPCNSSEMMVWTPLSGRMPPRPCSGPSPLRRRSSSTASFFPSN